MKCIRRVDTSRMNFVNQCCNPVLSSQVEAIISPVVCSRCFLHSSHKFRQYFVSSSVFLGIPFCLSRAISTSVSGGAKRTHGREGLVDCRVGASARW